MLRKSTFFLAFLFFLMLQEDLPDHLLHQFILCQYQSIPANKATNVCNQGNKAKWSESPHSSLYYIKKRPLVSSRKA